VTPNIRGYARMSVFVGFLAIFAAVLLLERIAAARPRLGRVLPAVVLGVGLLDQVTPTAVRPYAPIKAEYLRDQAFVRRVEATVPPRAMIFNLPYQPFPEAALAPGRRVISYDPMRPYFHARDLRWSYPAMAGRAADAFAADVAARPAPAMVRALAEAGFAGILIDRRAYAGGGAAAIEAALQAELGPAAVNSSDERMVFFDLGERAHRAFADVPPEEHARRRDLAAHPLYLRWTGGFYTAEETPEDGRFHWSGGAAEIEVDNDTAVTRRAVVSMTLAAGAPPITVAVDGDLLSTTVAVRDDAGAPLAGTVTLTPGRHFIRLRSDALPADAPHDSRRLVFRVRRAAITELP
jgi:phosphoglycerol transferase